MSLADDFLVSASAGTKIVAVTAPERDRFYQQLGQFVKREFEADGLPERVVLVATAADVGWFDWDAEELDFDSTSNDCFASMKTAQPGLRAGEWDPKIISSYQVVQAPQRTCLVVEDANYHLEGNNAVFFALRAFGPQPLWDVTLTSGAGAHRVFLYRRLLLCGGRSQCRFDCFESEGFFGLISHNDSIAAVGEYVG